jgi:hypothetical protein
MISLVGVRAIGDGALPGHCDTAFGSTSAVTAGQIYAARVSD